MVVVVVGMEMPVHQVVTLLELPMAMAVVIKAVMAVTKVVTVVMVMEVTEAVVVAQADASIAVKKGSFFTTLNTAVPLTFAPVT